VSGDQNDEEHGDWHGDQTDQSESDRLRDEPEH
jgi:hypothetical protein